MLILTKNNFWDIAKERGVYNEQPNYVNAITRMILEKICFMNLLSKIRINNIEVDRPYDFFFTSDGCNSFSYYIEDRKYIFANVIDFFYYYNINIFNQLEYSLTLKVMVIEQLLIMHNNPSKFNLIFQNINRKKNKLKITRPVYFEYDKDFK
jgi:hypothetical protein